MAEDLIEKGKKIFGTSESCRLSSFLLPEGKLLKSDRYFNSHPYAHIHDSITDKIKLNIGTVRFMNQTGSIRYHPMPKKINLSVDVNNPITPEQLEFLEKCSCFKKKDIIYDFYNFDEFIGHDWTGNAADCFKGFDRFKTQAKKRHRDIKAGRV